MSDQNKDLVPVQQKQVSFYDDELTALQAEDGHIYVALTQMCSALGINSQAQQRRITRHIVLNEGLQGVANLATPGGTQSGYVLRVDLVPLWLSGVRANAVKEDIRPKLVQYQREAAKVLWEAFQEGRLTAGEDFDSLMQQADPDVVQAYQIAQAVVRMARNQILLEARLMGRLNDHERRLEAVEGTLGDPGRTITPAQATRVSQAVKAIAMEFSKTSGRNEYGGVYGELYRRFNVPSYHQLPAAKFDEAMEWLTDWWRQVANTDDVPF
jgi:hypothetical protein